MKFEQAIEFVLAKEGGFTDNPRDAGNWTGGRLMQGKLKGTKYGISAASYPGEDIKSLTRDRAIMLYRRDFWNKLRVDELPEPIRLHVFDFAVNAGLSTAVKRLQEAAGVKIDGDLGPKTITGSMNVSVWRFAEVRVKHYASISNSNKSHREFLAGWLLRTLEITRISIINTTHCSI